MNSYGKVAAAIVVAVAIGAVGWSFLSGPGPGSTPPPSLGPSPTPALSPATDVLTGTYESTSTGISLSYPTGWSTRPAIERWKGASPPRFDDPSADVIYDPVLTDHLFVILASQPLAQGDEGAAWATRIEGFIGDGCDPSEPIAIAGEAGRLVSCGGALWALAWTHEEVYVISLYNAEDQQDYGRAWFERLLQTIEFHPPITGRADQFNYPFNYVLPGLPRLELAPNPNIMDYFEVRAPEWDDAGHRAGLILEEVSGGRVDPCDFDSPPLPEPLAPGPGSVIAYLKSLPGVTVTDETPRTVDYQEAVQVTMSVSPRPACPEVWAWAGREEPLITGVTLRLIAFDYKARRYLITIFGEPENPDWARLADGIVRSLSFGAKPRG